MYKSILRSEIKPSFVPTVHQIEMPSISEESLGLRIFRMHFYPILTSVNLGLASYNSAIHLPLRKDPHILQYYAP